MINQHIRQESAATVLCFIALIISHLACGSVSNSHHPKTTKPSQTTQSFNPLGNLLAQAQTALKSIEDPHPCAQSSVKFVLLHSKALSDDQQTQDQLTKDHFKLTTQVLKSHSINSLVTSKLAGRFTVVSTANTKDLPISLDVLSPALDRLKSKLSDYQGLTFITYTGQALKHGLQIKANCQIAQNLSESELFINQAQLLIGSLSTFEVFDLAELSNKCRDETYPWVRLNAELVGQKIRLLSRGLNQWGRPELELGPIDKRQVAPHFSTLVNIVERLRSTPMLSEQRPLNDLTFTHCLRAEHHYESCRRVILD